MNREHPVLAGWILRFASFSKPESHRKTVVAVAALVLTVAAVASWITLDISLAEIAWFPLLVSSLLVPGSIAATALEYRLIARMNGISVPFNDAIVVTVVGSVANLMPLPGAAAVRVGDILARRGEARRALSSTIGAGLLWLGWALLVAGAALISSSQGIAGGVFLIGGLGGLVLSVFLIGGWSSAGVWLSHGSLIAIFSLAVGAARLLLVFASLGVDAELLGSLVLVSAGAISSSVGIVPGGLGVREGIAALLGPLVGISSAAAIIAVSVMRVLGLLFQTPIALSVARRP